MKFVKKAAAVLFGALAIAGAAQAQDITVQYNGKDLDFTDAQPAIVEQRVMVPFRSVFEQMGAEVGYDEETRTATAEFNGNGIFFSIDGADIYSAEDPETPIYTMDVKPVFENDRVLVPVRALSEAGGLLVGWDQEESTVNILDPIGLSKYLQAAASELNKLAELELSDAQPTLYQGNLKVLDDGMDVNLGIKGWGTNDLAQLRLDLAAVDGFTPINLGMDIIAGDGYNLYIKTDALKELAALYPEDFELNLAAAVFSADSWYKYDFEEVIPDIDAFMSALESELSEISLEQSLSDELIYNVDINSAQQCREAVAEVYYLAEYVGPDYLTVDVKNDNSADIVYAIADEDVAFNLIITIEDGKLTSIGVNIESGDELYNLAFACGYGEGEPINIPENAIELNDVIDSITL